MAGVVEQSLQERTTAGARPRPTDGAATGGDEGRRAVWRAVGITGGLMAAFVLIGFEAPSVRRGVGRPALARPPLYGDYVPHVGTHLVVPLAAAVVLITAAALWPRLSDRAVPPVAYLALVTVSWAVAQTTGQQARLFAGYHRPAEAAEARLVGQIGLRRYVAGYGERTLPQVLSNHPPGRVLVRAGLQHLFGSGVVGPSIVLCLVAGLVVFPTWGLARELAGTAVARPAVLLLAASPAVLLYSWASWEAIEAPILLTAAFLLARGLARDELRTGWALAGGMVLGLSTFWTYSGAFLGLAVVLLVLVPSRGRAWRRLLAPAAGVAIGIGLLWALLGDNVVHTYLATRAAPEERIQYRIAHHDMRNGAYWLVGGPVAWLIGAGAPVVALTVLALRRIPWTRALLAVLGPLVLYASLPATVTSLIPGELERTWLWVYPLAAVTAAAALAPIVDRDRQGDGPWRRLVPGLVGIGVATAIAIEALWMLPA
ncbi:glycosyltransferase family 39 protein [Aquihabitans sp. McL0605]|uniref:glycosyltransferase family 39 protein n=1 Tax=Aquihabitans sp. McL0605 TaxID=3415671 RepID=UPI003CF7DCAD